MELAETKRIERSMTPQEVAELLQLSSKTVIKKAEEGHIPGRKIGNRWRFLPSKVAEYMGGQVACESRP